MLKKYLISIIFIAIVACFAISADFASAKIPDDNVSGWAWSSTIGWISFNGDNPEVPGGADYGVHICESDNDPNPYCAGVSAPKEGKLVRYAWSENIGWIMFNPPSPYPAVGPNYSAKLDAATNQITGWARACAGSPNGNCTGGVGAGAGAGGWDGWIKLAGTATDGSPYGSIIDFVPSPAEFRNFAWGSDVVGWISFNKSNCDTDKNGYVDSGKCGGDNVTVVIADYKVITDYSPKPQVTTNVVTPPNYCLSSPGATLFTWSVSGSDQSYFQLQIDNNSSFASPEIDSCTYPAPPGTCVAGSFTTSAYSPMTGLAYSATPYYWRVKVWSDSGSDSGWINGPSFSVPKHQYPDNEFLELLAGNAFNISPSEPSANEPFNITNNSSCYGIDNLPNNDSSYCSWVWNFTPDGNPLISSEREPAGVVFESEGTGKTITLTMSDTDGYTCVANKNIDVSLPFPEWREITPR